MSQSTVIARIGKPHGLLGEVTVQLHTDVPVLSAVLTPHHFHEHVEHRKYFHQHFAVKGTEVADACMKTMASER